MVDLVQCENCEKWIPPSTAIQMGINPESAIWCQDCAYTYDPDYRQYVDNLPDEATIEKCREAE